MQNNVGAIKKYQVYFTTHAFTQLVREIEDFISVETGGIFIGKRDGNHIYIFECIDSGVNCERSEVHFKRDYEYTEHLSYIVSSMYKDAKPVGYYHRHPKNFNRFSDGDFASNKEMAELFEGCISGLVTIFPNFLLNLWFVNPNGELEIIENYYIDDSKFKDILVLKDYREIIRSIEQNEYNYNIKSNRIVPNNRFEQQGFQNRTQKESNTGVASKKKNYGIIISENVSKERGNLIALIINSLETISKRYSIEFKQINNQIALIISNKNTKFSCILLEKQSFNNKQLFIAYNDESNKLMQEQYSVKKILSHLKNNRFKRKIKK